MMGYGGIRQCQGKIKYRNPDIAREVATAAFDKRQQILRSYQCEVCGYWHVGHTRPNVVMVAPSIPASSLNPQDAAIVRRYDEAKALDSARVRLLNELKRVLKQKRREEDQRNIIAKARRRDQIALNASSYARFSASYRA